MIQKKLLLLSLLLATTQSVWASCYVELGNGGSPDGLTTTDLNITAVAQTPLPNSSDIMKTSGSGAITYWVTSDSKGNAGEAGSVTFTPAGTTFTVDGGNKKGWLADASIPGLYFTLEAALPKPPQGPFTTWNKTTIYLSNDGNLNGATANGWGCSGGSRKMENATVTFNLSFYTTSAFDPAKASGKKLFTSRQQVGVLQNKTGKGGEIDVYINGPLTIATIGCAAFVIDNQTVNLGEINLSELKRFPDPPYNNTPFNIKMENCYTTPDLVLSFPSNQTKRIDSYTTTLVNTLGTSKGVGIALQYLTSQGSTDIGFNLDVTQPSTVPAKFLNYASGNGTLRMRAQLYVNDVNALAPGTLFIPTVMTITHP